MYLYGFDGWVIGLGACLSFLPVLYLLAERMRNAGKFTVADVLAFRLKARPVRVATAINTLLISRHLPGRAARRRGRRDRGAGGHQLPGRRADLRRLHGRLRRLRRHAGDDLGADHQGRDADDRGHRRRGRRAGQVQLQPGPAARHRGRQPPRRQRDPRPGHVPDVADPGDLDRPDDLHRHRRPAAHPHALLHRPGLQRGAQVRALHDRHHRHLHRDGHDHRLRRAGAARPGRRPRPSARAATSPRRCWPSSWAAARAPSAATSRSRCSPRPRSRRSSPSSPAS